MKQGLTKSDAFMEAWLSHVTDDPNAISWCFRQGWEDEQIPFLGARSPQFTTGARDGYYYKALGRTLGDAHPGKPDDGELAYYSTDINDEFPSRSTASYIKAAGDLFPGQPSKVSHRIILANGLEDSAALFARRILYAHEDLVRAMPVKVGHLSGETPRGRSAGEVNGHSNLSAHYAVWLETKDGFQTLIPLAVFPVSTAQPYVDSKMCRILKWAEGGGKGYLSLRFWNSLHLSEVDDEEEMEGADKNGSEGNEEDDDDDADDIEYDDADADDIESNDGDDNTGIDQLDALRAKFAESPLINVTDAEIPALAQWHRHGSAIRRYKGYWGLRHRLGQEVIIRGLFAPDGSARPLGKPTDYEKYSSIKALVDRIIQIAPQVSFTTVPTTPLARVTLDSFTLAFPADKHLPQPIPTTHINGVPSCTAFQDCIEAGVGHLGMCPRHIHYTLEVVRRGGSLSTRTVRHKSNEEDAEGDDDTPLVWAIPTQPDLRSSTIAQIRFLQQWLSASNSTIWFIDIEGALGLKGHSPVPFEIVIHDLAHDSCILHGRFTYPDALRDLPGILAPLTNRVDQVRARQCIQGMLRKSYPAEAIYLASSPTSAFHAQVEALGFDRKTHLVLGWGTSRCDEYALSRILRQKGNLLHVKEEVFPFDFVVFNISALVSKMMGVRYRNLSLAYVHSCMFPERDLPSCRVAEPDVHATKDLVSRACTKCALRLLGNIIEGNNGQ
ncbi:hypothetical protein K491DRAFT_782725 [Lophiostoma macrostomum CBS 122681]|uniref:Uncharacterized protein n=1 Tax=Lophiostoma macrostomum CBS 122681 TaxID=1314788 RepID=A0A6A6SVU5_9PLEO|nr:hypothetical protein K491DRAFT_782725 [Lophiostoma macrostomum CBS 122681]